MGIIRRWVDSNTGISIGSALWVVAEVQVDSERNGARIKVATYVGVAEYSAGKQPLAESERTVTGSAYFVNFSAPNYAMAQAYVAGLPEFSGSTTVP